MHHSPEFYKACPWSTGGKQSALWNCHDVSDRYHEVRPCNRSHMGSLLGIRTQRLSPGKGGGKKRVEKLCVSNCPVVVSKDLMKKQKNKRE